MDALAAQSRPACCVRDPADSSPLLMSLLVTSSSSPFLMTSSSSSTSPMDVADLHKMKERSGGLDGPAWGQSRGRAPLTSRTAQNQRGSGGSAPTDEEIHQLITLKIQQFTRNRTQTKDGRVGGERDGHAHSHGHTPSHGHAHWLTAGPAGTLLEEPWRNISLSRHCPSLPVSPSASAEGPGRTLTTSPAVLLLPAPGGALQELKLQCLEEPKPDVCGGDEGVKAQVSDVGEDLKEPDVSTVHLYESNVNDLVSLSEDPNQIPDPGRTSEEHQGSTTGQEGMEPSTTTSSLDQIQIHSVMSISRDQKDQLWKLASSQGEVHPDMFFRLDPENMAPPQELLKDLKQEDASDTWKTTPPVPTYEDISEDEASLPWTKPLEPEEHEDVVEKFEDEAPQTSLTWTKPLNPEECQDVAEKFEDISEDEAPQTSLTWTKPLNPEKHEDVAEMFEDISEDEAPENKEFLPGTEGQRRNFSDEKQNLLQTGCGNEAKLFQVAEGQRNVGVASTPHCRRLKDEDQRSEKHRRSAAGRGHKVEKKQMVPPCSPPEHPVASSSSSSSSSSSFSPSSPQQMEVFDTMESFLQAKALQFALTTDRRTRPESQLDSEGGSAEVHRGTRFCSDSGDETDTDDSCDYSKPSPAPGSSKPSPAPGSCKPSPAPGSCKPYPPPGSPKLSPAPVSLKPSPESEHVYRRRGNQRKRERVFSSGSEDYAPAGPGAAGPLPRCRTKEPRRSVPRDTNTVVIVLDSDSEEDLHMWDHGSRSEAGREVLRRHSSETFERPEAVNFGSGAKEKIQKVWSYGRTQVHCPKSPGPQVEISELPLKMQRTKSKKARFLVDPHKVLPPGEEGEECRRRSEPLAPRSSSVSVFPPKKNFQRTKEPGGDLHNSEPLRPIIPRFQVQVVQNYLKLDPRPRHDVTPKTPREIGQKVQVHPPKPPLQRSTSSSSSTTREVLGQNHREHRRKLRTRLHDSAPPLMKRSMNEAKHLTRAWRRDSTESRSNVGEGYKWQETRTQETRTQDTRTQESRDITGSVQSRWR